MVTRPAAVAALAALVALVVAAGCQGRRRDRGGGGPPPEESPGDGDRGGSGGDPGSGAPVDLADAGADLPDDARKGPDEPEAPPDPNKQIAELGAIPAWQAVVDRAQLLARRGQQGVIYGQVGPAILLPPPPAPPAPPAPPDGGAPSAPSDGAPPTAAAPPPAADAGLLPSPYVWLVDDTEGNGALGVWLALGKLAAKEGDRIAVRGAWALDAERRWYWKAEAIQRLAPLAASAPKDPPAAVPGHAPPAGPLPPGARPIAQAKDNDLVYFQIVGPTPLQEGDGWPIAAQLGDLTVALLLLPGERPSYGAQDLRAPGERWQLRRQVIYWVRIGKLRPQGAGKPPVVRALTGPVRVM